ncbi:MAG: type 1 glutamine amidotransferase [Bdellovibrionaceae bacterium]|nr:type 1 glutamine amidotransferase [Pseudobdellovibrionaceae bacterium]
MPMRIHILQHTAQTPPGAILPWLDRHSLRYSTTRMDLAEVLPDPSTIDWLIICGGGMGVHDEEKYPWLRDEKRFLARVLDSGAAVLGLCLGGQLIAEVCGGHVVRHTHWEIGWHPIQMEDGTHLEAFQFHQDTFSIPPGAQQLATGHGCENQGFAIGERVIGVQFHPEATEAWVRQCTEEHVYLELRERLSKETANNAESFVQSPAEILARLNRLEAQGHWLDQTLTRLHATAQREKTPGRMTHAQFQM